jgi:signal transduction histidine kinase
MFADYFTHQFDPSIAPSKSARLTSAAASRNKNNFAANSSSGPDAIPAVRSATTAQRMFALGVCVAMVGVTMFLMPFAHAPWAKIQAFLPMYQTAIIGTSLLTAFLMYGHYKATRSIALLHLSASYLYTAGILIMQFLSFPDAFLKQGQFFGGPQTTIWLWCFWHLGPALGVLFYAWSEYRHPGLTTANHKAALLRTAIGLFFALGATSLLVTVFHNHLPPLDFKGDFSRITSTGIAPGLELILAVALTVLWRASRFRNVLHVWLGIVLVALLCDNAITMLAGSRLTMGWYVGRFGALIASSVMMLVYLQGMKESYQRSIKMAALLTSSNARLDSEIVQREGYEEKLRETDRRKDAFLAMLAHELRNPLAPISAAAELLNRFKLDEMRVKKTGEIIGRQVKHMTGLIDDLLDVSRVTSGLVELDNTPLDIRLVVSDAVEQISPLIESRRHHLLLNLSPDRSTFVGDKKRIVQIIANLLTNAAKYTNHGGNIQLTTKVEHGRLILTVEDDGIGMAPELVVRVFDLFTQAERTPDRTTGGLGLGLALVKRLVELHGGNVTCASQGLGNGSQFMVCLPCLTDPDQKIEQHQTEQDIPALSKALHIMVVDDNADAAQMLCLFLETSGHTVIVEDRSRRALERARLELPDVCLIDIGLPEMDGNELAHRLRLQPETTKTILVAITGYGQDHDRKNSMAAGFDHYMIKPVDMTKLAVVLAGSR